MGKSMTASKSPLLLTPGPLTTSRSVKEAMLTDWGSRDKLFIEMNARIRSRLLNIANAKKGYVCVPVQGSGTFAVEAALGTLLAKSGEVLIIINGAYGRRMARICEYLGIAFETYETAEDTPPEPDQIARIIEGNHRITHVACVHCETTSGILNPIADIAYLVAERKRALIIDAMSTFGALSLDVQDVPCDAIVASSNKCLEGTPGMGFAIIRESTLEGCEGNARSLSLDLYDQWLAMEGNGQWRFTPPTHVIAALDQALEEHEQEGGVDGRGARYKTNCRTLIDGMRKLGFQTYLPDDVQAPIIVTFLTPGDANFDFGRFYDGLHEKGFAIYPGKLTKVDSFRMGCIGRLDEADMERAVKAVEEVLRDLGVKQHGPPLKKRA